MKKIVLLFVAVIGFTAQSVNAQELRFGAKGGVNFANLTGNDVDADMRTTFHIGAVAEYMFTEKFGIQPELLYSAQGAKADGEDFELKVNYLNIPVMFKYYVADGFSLQAGPQIGFALNSKVKEGKVEVETNDFVKTLDFGLNFGLGYKFNDNIFIEGRYNLGLTNIFDTSSGDVEGKAKNGVFQLSVGYMF